MITTTIDTDGIEKGLLSLLGSLDSHAERGLSRIGDKIQADAYDKVPNDTGELVDSYKYEVYNMEMEAGYDIAYSKYQHEGQREDGSYVIVNRPAGGESKFLESTVEDNIDDYTDIMQASILK